MKMQKGLSPGIRQLEFDAPKSASKRKVESNKKASSRLTYGLEAFGVEKEGQSSLRKFFENPRDVIGYPPNPIMKIQLLKLWKEAAGAEDIGDFATFMNEASDLTYVEAKKNLLRTYGTLEHLHVKSARDIAEVFHAEMCESAIEECGKGDATACKVACEDCGVTDDCISARQIARDIANAVGIPVVIPLAQGPLQKPHRTPEFKPIEEVHKYLEERGIEPGKPVKTKLKAKTSTTIRKIKVPKSGIVRLSERDMHGTIVLEW